MASPVFISNVDISRSCPKENLYDLLTKDVAVAVENPLNDTLQTECHFKPNSDKFYAPKRRTPISTLRVRTVRDIRKQFEQDSSSIIQDEISKKEKYLLKKISSGNAADDNTRRLAGKLQNSTEPLNKTIWQMILNVNPNKHLHPIQYVLWNSRKIKVNGSKGGEKKYLFNFDLNRRKICSKRQVKYQKAGVNKSLLTKSIDVKFKPGPLSFKDELDCSAQQHNLGKAVAVKLPEVGLTVQPEIGVSLDPTISSVLNTLRGDDEITEKWAEFAVATLGTSNSNGASQFNKAPIVFDMQYKNNQNKLLMRRDSDSLRPIKHTGTGKHRDTVTDEKVIEVVMNDILNAVEISLNQDDMFQKDNDFIASAEEKMFEKSKRKYGELEKLDVTIIKIDEASEKDSSKPCQKDCCTLGCVCSSLETNFHIKQHCGRVTCLFECTCGFINERHTINSKNEDLQDVLPNLLVLESRLNSKLAKEELKFHQTVLLTEEKSIVLKAHRRNIKIPKRYVSLENKDGLRYENGKVLSINLPRLQCDNIAPFCMVHNLYNCYCGCKFTRCLTDNDLIVEKVASLNDSIDETEECTKRTLSISSDNSVEWCSSTINVPTVAWQTARTKPYAGRKYLDTYYKGINAKIFKMEHGDNQLKQNMSRIIEKTSKPIDVEEIHDTDKKESKTQEETPQCSYVNLNDDTKKGESFPKLTSNKFISWLEMNYKQNKERMESCKPIPIKAPHPGKRCLCPSKILLEKFRKKRNFFMVTKNEPYRTYMTINDKDPALANCIKVEEIPPGELNKYPVIVKNLVENIDVNNNFYILLGNSHCWEIVACIKRLNKSNGDGGKSSESLLPKELPKDGTNKTKSLDVEVVKFQTEDKAKEDDSGSLDAKDKVQTKDNENMKFSKWFIMLIENDFEEIQFHSKGFFVKHSSLLKAIDVARVSNKTVRLSPQSHSGAKTQEGPLFGIYAVPNTKDCSAFLGPYNMSETFDAEIIKKSMVYNVNKRSRGFWLYVNSRFNYNVIENPMSYIQDKKGADYNICLLDQKSLIEHDETDESEFFDDSDVSAAPDTPVKTAVIDGTSTVVFEPNRETPEVVNEENVIKNSVPNTYVKIAPKPIKIKKNFVVLKPEEVQHFIKTTATKLTPSLQSMLTPTPVIQDTFSLAKTAELPSFKKPVAEIAPQRNLSCSAAVTGEQKTGMFILKPEEINKRMSQSTLVLPGPTTDHSTEDNNMDIEDFVASTSECKEPTVCVISDESDNEIDYVEHVVIACRNIPNLGCIKAMQNKRGQISFEFPGFKYSDYYTKKETFDKINQVLSRKVYVPKHMKVLWQVMQLKADRRRRYLKAEQLTSDMVLTRNGLCHKSVLAKPNLNYSDIKTYIKNKDKESREKTATASSKSSTCSSGSVDTEDEEDEQDEFLEVKQESDSEEELLSCKFSLPPGEYMNVKRHRT